MKIYSRVKRVVREGGLRLLIKKTWRRVRVNYLDFFAHQMPYGLPPVQVEMKKYKASQEDVLIAKRILALFHKTLKDEEKYAPKKSYEDAWDNNKKVNHSEFFEVLYSNDPRSVADYLCNVSIHKATRYIGRCRRIQPDNL